MIMFIKVFIPCLYSVQSYGLVESFDALPRHNLNAILSESQADKNLHRLGLYRLCCESIKNPSEQIQRAVCIPMGKMLIKVTL